MIFRPFRRGAPKLRHALPIGLTVEFAADWLVLTSIGDVQMISILDLILEDDTFAAAVAIFAGWQYFHSVVSFVF
jgi:hypothetical protein